MKAVLFAVFTSVAVAFTPVATPNSAARPSTCLYDGGVIESSAQVASWIALFSLAAGARDGAGKTYQPGAFPGVASLPKPAPAASSSSSSSAASGDVSIPYDAAARLAYEQAGSPGDFAAFKTKYEADAVALVKSKQKK